MVEREGDRRPVGAVLLASFERKARKLLGEEGMLEVADVVSYAPEVGEVLRETGGLRKLRVALEGRGKSGGARVIYYFHGEGMPVFLLAIFGKNEKANLSKAERNALRDLVKMLRAEYGAEESDDG